jgi:hypothetical protein
MDDLEIDLEIGIIEYLIHWIDAASVIALVVILCQEW